VTIAYPRKTMWAGVKTDTSFILPKPTRVSPLSANTGITIPTQTSMIIFVITAQAPCENCTNHEQPISFVTKRSTTFSRCLREHTNFLIPQKKATTNNCTIFAIALILCSPTSRTPTTSRQQILNFRYLVNLLHTSPT